jgi:hypothetical protein
VNPGLVWMSMRLRLAELIAAWSLVTDLGLGLLQERLPRQCRIALGLRGGWVWARRIRAAVYYVAMLAWVGCTADSHELAGQFSDDLALRADGHAVDLAGLPRWVSCCAGGRRAAALRRPFLYFPLRHHFEQSFHVRHCPERHGAGGHH